MPKTDKRDEIVRVSMELIAEHGFHDAPMSLIAKQAGVGAGTIYRYFENKDALIMTLYKELEARIYPVVKNGYELDKDIRQRFLHLMTVLLHYFIDNPLDFLFMQQFFNSPYGVECRREKFLQTKEGYDVFRVLYEDAISQMVMKNLPIVILFDLAFGSILAVARDHILGFITLDDHLIESTIEACWDSVKR